MTDLFIDTNVLLYFVTRHTEYFEWARDVLESISSGENKGVISLTILDELLYKLIISEVSERQNIHVGKVVRLIKSNPQILKDLSAYEVINNVEKLSLTILEVNKQIFDESKEIIRKYGLLTHDVLHAAACKVHHIKHIATNDSDFERIPFLTVWKP